MRRPVFTILPIGAAAFLASCGRPDRSADQPEPVAPAAQAKDPGSAAPTKSAEVAPAPRPATLVTAKVADNPGAQALDATGKLSSVKIGVGRKAYDNFPDDLKDRFIADWKGQLASLEGDVADFVAAAQRARDGVAKARSELEKFESRNKGELKAKDKVFMGMQKDRAAAVEKAESDVVKADRVVAEAKAYVAAHEQNDPPYFAGPFAGCRTGSDIEERLGLLAKQKMERAALRAQAEADRKAEEEFDSDGLVLLQKTVHGEAGRFGGDITGTVVNRRAKDIRYAQITFALYDRTGAQVGTAMANIAGLDAGGRWNFKAAIFREDVTSYKVKELIGR